MTAVTARRLVLAPGEVSAVCRLVGVPCPPGFTGAAVTQVPDELVVAGQVHRSVAAGVIATCSPHVGVHVVSTTGDVTAAFGMRGDLGGSLLRVGGSGVEVSAWPAHRLAHELTRAVPVLGSDPRPPLHLPLTEVAEHPDLRATVSGTLRATVVAPPDAVGQVTWLATRAGWLALVPAEVHDGTRWAVVRPVEPADLGAAVAPLLAAALA